MERRILSAAGASVSVRQTDNSKTISGYGAVFYDGNAGTEYSLWEDLTERIMPGAFDKAIKERQDVRGLFNHDPSLVLGRTAAKTMTLQVDGRGLFYSIDPGATSIAKDVVEHINRGDVSGSSFTFIPVEENWVKQEGNGKKMWIREIRSVDLYDVGPVTFPAYTATSALARAMPQDVEAARKHLLEHQRKIALPAKLAAVRARVLEIGLNH